MIKSKKGIIPLTLLRVTSGWLFLHEGFYKILTEGWTSKIYLSQSTGPLKDFFKWIIEDNTMLSITDNGITIALIVIGTGLILGLMERFNAAAGILLLVMFYLAYPPVSGITGPHTEGNYLLVNKNLVMIMALAVIYTFNCAKVTGLDRLRSRNI